MGCSPSKGSNFGTQGPLRRGRMLPTTPQESPRDCNNGQTPDATAPKEGETGERKATGALPLQRETPQKKRSVVDLAPEAVNVDKLGSQGVDSMSQRKEEKKQGDKQDLTEKKSAKKPKKNNKSTKVLKKKDKEKDKPPVDQKVDFPEPLVKAHQATYAFLNPSMNKYDILLGLLEQATQTQVSMQPMVAFMVLRYQELIQGLTEITEEGEKVLKENGEHLAWPNEMKKTSPSTPLKSGSGNAEPPPDLLQQLLQYTTQRMQNVSQTVRGIGDSALEEAVEYFASVSELLEEKLIAKRVAETRLTQLLSRIETASVRKPGPEDSALFSEDSGIGAENESLAGSERHRRRESCASTETNRSTHFSPLGYRSVNIRQGVLRRRNSRISPSVSLNSLNSIDSTCTLMAFEQKDSVLGSVSLDDGEEDDDDDDHTGGGMEGKRVGFRMRSNSSPLDPEHQPCRPPPKRLVNPQNVEMTQKMKNAISGRIQFVSSQPASAKTKIGDSPKTSRRQWTDDEERSPKRPQTSAANRRAVAKKTPSAKERRSRSADSLRSKGEDSTLHELERTQKELSEKLQRLNKSKVGVNTRTAPPKQSRGNSPAQSPARNRARPPPERDANAKPVKDKSVFTRNNSGKHEATSDTEETKQKDRKTFTAPVKATPPPSPPSSPRPSSRFSRGRNSVKKLIDTFSQSIGDLDHPKVLGPLKGVRKCGVPVMPGLGNVEAVLSTGVSSCRPESTLSVKTDDLDLDSLPPPSLEVLMDDSFDSAKNFSAGVVDDGKSGKSAVLKRSLVSQRLKSSVQSLLPSKGSLPHCSKVFTPTRPEQQDTSAHQTKFSQADSRPETDPGKVKTASLYKQARKIIHIQDSPDSQLDKSSIYVSTTPSANQAESARNLDCGNRPGTGPKAEASAVPPSSVVSCQPPATPPASKGRMLPSTPSTPTTLNRRLPSPQTLRRQPSPNTSASPPVNRKLPTPPPGQRTLLSPNTSNPPSVSSYPFKAPSPPASPKVHRWSRENSMEDLSSRSINNARSVFCPASRSLFEAQPCPVPRPPQAWTYTGVSFVPRSQESRGRFPVSVQGPRPFVRRSQSDRRPSLSLPPCSPAKSVAETCGSEPSISTKGLGDEPTREEELWGSQSDLRAVLRSVSHPDLCVVGQALHRD
ncbi:photoreceptor cilium actin regulator [Genypterus blacodes]|uniref:photoreceptor cilium actin regulator n=1 Tax=Genypterus blacodes TaxID=154954 RepID=UPI003F76972B